MLYVEYNEFLTKIFELDEDVRFVGMYRSDFSVITDSYQPSKYGLSHLSREEMKDSVRYDMKRWDTYKLFHKQLGETLFAMVKFEKTILLTFSINRDEYLRVSLEPNADYKKIISAIESLIMKNPVIT
ncbi:MAG: hypothetical protein EB150_04055 [Nitrososphaeria archaeon]|nr:hypothetical protein [Nitrososphaeria archaeon]NDB51086.1 hypothetical protein [Nitrosopumilaceae archaeon]NDB87898.1 hypothetical protein [Nitrososphaerota archaeon]NDB46183.1 hypothetical protein [Nitrososphaeria archaeon]NDB62646.1 hypothetical protein [Nitrosopumilaceae archaeon]